MLSFSFLLFYSSNISDFFLKVTKLDSLIILYRELSIISDIFVPSGDNIFLISRAVGGQSFFFPHLFLVKISIYFSIRDDIAASLSAN